jgi:hypothetical protein
MSCPYGICEAGAEENSLSLRRGEFISSISGMCGTSPKLASCLFIRTSEGQEGFAGACDTQTDAAWDFVFTAVDGHEIVGVHVGENGALCGIRQAPLPPSRVPGGAKASSATASARGNEQGPCGSQSVQQMATPLTARGGTSARHGSFAFSRIKETFDEY